MTLFKRLFSVVILLVVPSCPVSFFPQQYPYLYTEEYELFLKELCCDALKSETKNFENSWRLEQMKHDFLWYLKIPFFNIIPLKNFPESSWLQRIPLWKLGSRQGRGVKIAVLDTKVSDCQISIISSIQKKHSLSLLSDLGANLTNAEKLYAFNQSISEGKKRLQYTDPKKHISRDLFQKNHGLHSIFCIQHIAPAVEIIPIHVLNDEGLSHLATLLQGVQKAVELKADILHLGLRVHNIDTADPTFKKLCKLFAHFRFVVIAAGNEDTNGKQQLFMNGEQNNRTISVGSFKKEGNSYPVCSFSQSQLPYGPHVLMPGQNIICPLWVEQINDFLWIPIDGTSISSALMSGCLALLLSELELTLTNQQIRYLIQTCCDQQAAWEKKSLWGTLNIPKMLFTVKVLQELSKKITAKNLTRAFEKIVDRVVLCISFDNVDVKTKNSYTQFLFDKKFDSDLAILVEHSIKQVKESS